MSSRNQIYILSRDIPLDFFSISPSFLSLSYIYIDLSKNVTVLFNFLIISSAFKYPPLLNLINHMKPYPSISIIRKRYSHLHDKDDFALFHEIPFEPLSPTILHKTPSPFPYSTRPILLIHDSITQHTLPYFSELFTNPPSPAIPYHSSIHILLSYRDLHSTIPSDSPSHNFPSPRAALAPYSFLFPLSLWGLFVFVIALQLPPSFTHSLRPSLPLSPSLTPSANTHNTHNTHNTQNAHNTHNTHNAHNAHNAHNTDNTHTHNTHSTHNTYNTHKTQHAQHTATQHAQQTHTHTTHTHTRHTTCTTHSTELRGGSGRV